MADCSAAAAVVCDAVNLYRLALLILDALLMDLPARLLMVPSTEVAGVDDNVTCCDEGTGLELCNGVCDCDAATRFARRDDAEM